MSSLETIQAAMQVILARYTRQTQTLVALQVDHERFTQLVVAELESRRVHLELAIESAQHSIDSVNQYLEIAAAVIKEQNTPAIDPAHYWKAGNTDEN